MVLRKEEGADYFVLAVLNMVLVLEKKPSFVYNEGHNYRCHLKTGFPF